MQTFIHALNIFKSLEIQKSVNFEEMNQIFISHHSTVIEGNTLTEDETRVLLLDGLTTAGKPLYDHEMVKDHMEALQFIVNRAKSKELVSTKFIQDISAKVMRRTGSVINAAAGNYDVSKGDLRKSAVSVGSRYFVAYDKVERELDKLCTNINKTLPTVNTTTEIYNLAFDAHFYLVSIHPFADGNGRVSRLLMNYILAYHKQPLATIFGEDKAAYYAALESARENDKVNLEPIREFLYSQQEKYLKLEIDKFNKGQNLNFEL